MKKHVVKTNTVAATVQLGEQLAMNLRPSDVVTLQGDLGSGKTTFTKGIANGLGIRQTVNSPTFTIVKEYEGELPLYHIDAYRLEDSEEDIGFDEYFNASGISIVEWPQFIEPFLPVERLDIQMTYIDDHTRELAFIPRGKRFESVVVNLIG